MEKLLDEQFRKTEIPTQPITARELELIDIIKSKCLTEYLELEDIKYEVHCIDLENAYKQGFNDCLKLNKK